MKKCYGICWSEKYPKVSNKGKGKMTLLYKCAKYDSKKNQDSLKKQRQVV